MIVRTTSGLARKAAHSLYFVSGIWTHQYTRSGVWGTTGPTGDDSWNCTPPDQDASWDCTDRTQQSSWAEVDTS